MSFARKVAHRAKVVNGRAQAGAKINDAAGH